MVCDYRSIQGVAAGHKATVAVTLWALDVGVQFVAAVNQAIWKGS
jgi:hypothetical protein